MRNGLLSLENQPPVNDPGVIDVKLSIMYRCIVFLSLVAFTATPAHAQTIREDVKKHVEEGLEDSKKK